jgi:Domain of unknown function (DUF4382)
LCWIKSAWLQSETKLNKVVPIAIVVLLATVGLTAYAYTNILPSIYGNSSNGSPTGTSGTTGLGSPGTGSLSIYLTDPPPSNATLHYLLLNVTSITLRYASNSTQAATNTTTSTTTTGTTSSITSTTTSISGPEDGNESGTIYVFDVPSNLGTNVNITQYQGSALLLGSPKVPAGNVTGVVFNITGARAFWTNGSSSQLKVVADGKFMLPVHFTVQPDGSTSLTVQIAPGDIHVSQGNMKVLTPVIHVTVVSTGQNGTNTQTAETSETETTTTTSSVST